MGAGRQWMERLYIGLLLLILSFLYLSHLNAELRREELGKEIRHLQSGSQPIAKFKFRQSNPKL